MHIAILGAGNVGSNLGKLWAAQGHRIYYGVRDPQSDKSEKVLAETGTNAEAVTVPEAIAAGEIVVLSVGWPNAADALQSAVNWSGKILIDATNRDVFDYEAGRPGPAADVARLAPGARVIKAFNTLGAEQFGPMGAQGASMFICGDDALAKERVRDLTEELGFDVVDAGPLDNAPLLENLAKLWIYLAYRGGYGREVAFKLLRG